MILIGNRQKNINKSVNFRNLNSLKLFRNCFELLTICPFNLKRKKIFSKIYATLFSGTLIVALSWIGIRTETFISLESNIFETYLKLSVDVIPLILCTIVLHGNFKRPVKWRKLFLNLLEFDTREQNNSDKSMTLKDAKNIVIINLFVLAYSILIYFFWKEDVWYRSKAFIIHKYLPGLITLLFEVNIAGYIWEMSLVLQSRYNHLKECLQIIILKKKFNKQWELNVELQKLISSFKILFRFVTDINEILGATILICLLDILTRYLDTFHWMMFIYGSDQSNGFIVQNCLYLLVSSVSITYNFV